MKPFKLSNSSKFISTLEIFSQRHNQALLTKEHVENKAVKLALKWKNK